jgi:hypothetical protein
MEAENDGGSPGVFQSNAIGADGNPAVGSNFERGPKAPNIGPPRAARGWSQDGAFLFLGQIPSSLGREFKFAVGLFGIAVEAQSVDVRVGFLDFGDALAGEIGWKALLPELVFPFDFALGLRGGSVNETNVVEAERRTELS